MLRRALFALLVLVLGGLTVAAWYAYDKGFTKKWRTYVTEEFRKQGIEVSFPRLTLDPFHGLVARDVKVFDAKDRRRTLAVIDQIILGINYADALRGESFLDTLDLRDASLSLPVNPANLRGPKIDISRLNARLLFPPHQIYLASAEAEIHGIRVQAAGRLIHPEALRARKEAMAGSPGEIVASAVEQLKTLRFEGAPPVLSVEFNGDLEQPHKIFVSAKLRAENVRRKSHTLMRLEVAATYRNGVAELQQLFAADALGELEASGTFNPKHRESTLRLRSSLDLQVLARAWQLAPVLDEFVFYDPPALELAADAVWSDPPRIQAIGRVTLGRFACKSVVFENFVADASWSDQRWSVRDLRLVHRTGEFTGDAMQLPEEFRAKLRCTAPPRVLLPMLTGKLAEWVSRLDFHGAPALKIEARGKRATFEDCTLLAEPEFLAAGEAGERSPVP